MIRYVNFFWRINRKFMQIFITQNKNANADFVSPFVVIHNYNF